MPSHGGVSRTGSGGSFLTRRATRWTVVVEPEGRAGDENMAMDYSLLIAAQGGAAYLRLYRWSPPCLSFGRNERACVRYDRRRIEQLKINTVRRPTGGRAVWHDAEVTYAVAAPIETFGSLRETYITIHRMLAGALRSIGVPVELAPRPYEGTPGPAAGACFALPVGGELLIGTGKLVGSAQVREGNAFLQHGSILLANDQDVVTRVSRGKAPAAHAVSLEDVGHGKRFTFTDVAAAIRVEAANAWPSTWAEESLPAVTDCGRFADAAWTWRA